MCLNNDEEDTIVGNFTSKGIDTLHVKEVMPDSFDYHNGDKTEAINGSILEYLCTKVERKVNHGKMFNISFEEFLVLSENYPYFCRTI